MPSPDQRRNKRYSIDRPVTIELTSGERLHGHAINLSVQGIGMVSPEPLENGSVVRLRLQLTNMGRGSLELCVQARVIHGYLKDGGHGLGMEFEKLGVKEQIALLDFADFRERLAASRNEAVPLHAFNHLIRK